MMPRIPMRATVRDLLMAMTFLLNGWLVVGVQPSVLAVFRGVPAVQGVDLVGRYRLRLTERPGQVDSAGGIFAHHRGLDRAGRGRADGEDAVVAHEHRGRAVPGQGGDDAPADLVPPDERERPDRYLAAELVRHGGDHA